MKDKRPFHEDQPIEGETFLACAHASRRIKRGRDTGKIDWFRIPGGLEFVRPNGTKGVATWVAICTRKCFRGPSAGIDHVDIGGDYVWKGNAPAIREKQL